jgi:hypothetical protein
MRDGNGDSDPPDNVVRLGSETMGVIGAELRRMYAVYLQQQPSERIAELMRKIERGEDIA